jgi:hypothetical protein
MKVVKKIAGDTDNLSFSKTSKYLCGNNGRHVIIRTFERCDNKVKRMRRNNLCVILLIILL